MKRKKIEYRYYNIEEDNPVLVLHGDKWKQNYGNDVDGVHFHNHLEIGYCFSGSGTLVLGDEKFRYSGGNFTFIAKNYHHTTVSDRDSICHWGFIFVDTDSLLKKVFGDNHYLIDKVRRRTEHTEWFLSTEEAPALSKLIQGILQTFEERQDLYQQEIEFLCGSLLIELSRMNIGEEMRETLLEEDNLAPALEYINKNYGEDIRVGMLAQMCHMSETHLRRCFQKSVQMSPLEYLNSIRISAACEKLSKSKNSVNLIAEQCGFTTSSTFNRNFIRICGCAPVEWRKRQIEYEHLKNENEIKKEQGW